MENFMWDNSKLMEACLGLAAFRVALFLRVMAELLQICMEVPMQPMKYNNLIIQANPKTKDQA
jgi:hypothetical protein